MCTRLSVPPTSLIREPGVRTRLVLYAYAQIANYDYFLSVPLMCDIIIDDVIVTMIFVGFIPYGEIHGDTILPHGLDESTPLENLEVPLVFFNTYETEIYVRFGR